MAEVSWSSSISSASSGYFATAPSMSALGMVPSSSLRPVLATAGDPLAGLGVGRILEAQPPGELHLVGVRVRDRQGLEFAVLVEQIDAAPVREPRHRRERHLSDRLTVVERSAEEAARIGQEADPRRGLHLALVQDGALERLAQLGAQGEQEVLDAFVRRLQGIERQRDRAEGSFSGTERERHDLRGFAGVQHPREHGARPLCIGDVPDHEAACPHGLGGGEVARRRRTCATPRGGRPLAPTWRPRGASVRRPRGASAWIRARPSPRAARPRRRDPPPRSCARAPTPPSRAAAGAGASPNVSAP